MKPSKQIPTRLKIDVLILHSRARVDRTRDRYRDRTHFRCAPRPRVCPPNSVLVACPYLAK